MYSSTLIEEFGAKYHYKQGSSNCIANAISHLPTLATTTLCNSKPSPIPHSDSFLSPTFQDPELFDCFLQYPLLPQGKLPFHMKTIFDYHQQDAVLLATVVNDSQQYQTRLLGGHSIMTFTPLPNSDWKIDVPENNLYPLVDCHLPTPTHISSSSIYRGELSFLQPVHFSTLCRVKMHNCAPF